MSMRENEERFWDRLVAKFLSKLDADRSNDSCWEWRGSKQYGRGYGRLAYGHKRHGTFYFESAHRFSYRYFKGDIGKDLCVCHKCDNPGCVNPDHLFLGTQTENQADKMAKGRTSCGESHSLATKAKTPRGSRNKASILRESDIPEILKLRKQGERFRQIGQRFGVSKTAIQYIFEGRSWAHITGIKSKRQNGYS